MLANHCKYICHVLILQIIFHTDIGMLANIDFIFKGIKKYESILVTVSELSVVKKL